MKEKIKELLDSNCIIIFDTNVYLNLYEYSPHIADFFVDLVALIKSQLYMPYTVKREFEKNHKECQGRQKKKFQNVPKSLKKYTEQARAKIHNQMGILEKFKFPGIDRLQETCDDKFLDIEKAFLDYVEEHNVFEEINEKFLDEDRILGLVNDICTQGRLIDAFSLDDAYCICEEGKRRYAKCIPPGFEDAKDKDGLDMYSDLFVWKETIKLCQNCDKNLIFVTDDVKKDWWTQKPNEKDFFHEDLIKEFEENTCKKVIGVTSHELFTNLADIFKIEVPETIESVLKFSTERYIKTLFEEEDLVDAISDKLSYSGETYVDTDTLTNYDGSYFEISDVVDNIELIDFEFEGYKDKKALYRLTIKVNVNAESRQYWGKDSDTKEIILSDNYYTHILEGELEIRLVRDAEFYLEDLLDDKSFIEIEIISGDLEQLEAFNNDDLCVECGRNFGDVPHRGGGLVCSDCAVSDTNGEICPRCGEKVPHSLMAGNGFCIRCTKECEDL